ncbi:DUF89 domain-containing protein [Dendrothele bispora CBS 962.96]|uniref:Sugar phosphate phosphatase n=1 Tax=Dendrothele bispora (strain CBS 962.96) TaxID=1314807 RepID=A0A4S8LXB6_DENBC|nr:DUF89 domain-containing protein [Dendrothele bispora CBS 962.96]
MFEPPFPPYDPTDKSGFSYDTVVKRWPVILTSIVDQLHRENHDLQLYSQHASDPEQQKASAAEKLEEGKAIIEQISKVKYQMARDHVMEPIPQDGEPHVELYNSELERLAESSRNTWFTAPWLYAECYLYRFLRSMFTQTKHWHDYDPFGHQKLDVFRKSGNSIYRIATMMHELGKEKSMIEANPENLKVFFQEMIQMCLWGNATDLSLLTHMSLTDIERLQTVEKEAQTARQAFIMRDDQEAAWDQLRTSVDGRVDFVLDNSGFELFTDLVFADWLVTYTPYVAKVVFHPKLIPWFVSDVTPPDFKQTITSISDPAFLQSTPTPEQQDHLNELAARLKQHVESGVFSMSVPLDNPLGGGGTGKEANFWTTPVPYWNMATYDNELWQDLRKSSLVIFKGDLNYRKLTGDIQWPAWTPFTEALGPLAGSFPLLSLRTNKADVAVGLDKEKVRETEERDAKWRVNGKFALISFAARS